MQLQQVCRVHSDAVVNVLNKADGIEQVQLIQMQSIAERLAVAELGATFLGGLVGDVSIPKRTGTATAY